MPTFCCVCKKNASNDSTENRRTFHRLPVKQPDLLEHWLRNMKMGVDFKATANVRVCSDHFPDKCFVGSDQRRKLVEGSIPELFTRMKCMYCGCEKFAFTENTFHKLPADTIEKEKWLLEIRKYMPELTTTDDSVLCSAHFEANCFYLNGKYVRLRPKATPTVFFVPELSADASHSERNEPVEEMLTPMHMDEPIVVQDIVSVAEPDVTVHSTPDSQVNPRKRKRSPSHDPQHSQEHNYDISGESLGRKYIEMRKKYKVVYTKLRQERKRTGRMKKKLCSLAAIVKQLRKIKKIPNSVLNELDSIAEQDVSQFFRRYHKNRLSEQRSQDEKYEYDETEQGTFVEDVNVQDMMLGLLDNFCTASLSLCHV